MEGRWGRREGSVEEEEGGGGGGDEWKVKGKGYTVMFSECDHERGSIQQGSPPTLPDTHSHQACRSSPPPQHRFPADTPSPAPLSTLL